MNSINIEKLKEIILENLENKSVDLKRVFHGRGNFYEGFHYLIVDSINDILMATFFEEVDVNTQKEIIKILDEVYATKGFKTLIIQRRYDKNNLYEIVRGKISENVVAYENGLKYALNFSNQNIGIFPDMKNGRSFIKEISKDKKVLNLFSYTCAFSVCAISGGALKVVNVDMAKNVLTTGRTNHHLNNLDTKKVKFLPYDILKSWNRIKKEGPYEIIIIDPPSLQKGSFEASKDYEKIVRRLNELAASKCTILS